MKLLSFRGGVHPDDKKKATKDLPIVHLPAPKTLVFPLWQHIGAACAPIVAPGDHVYYGQKIGDCDQFVSAPLHTSVSGTVVAIENRLTIRGQRQECVIIENDFQDEPDPSILPENTAVIPEREEIIRLIREAGIIGLGGAGFPTHVKLTPGEGKKIDTVIVNGAECEPYITSDYRILLESPDYVLYGLKVLLKAFGIENGYIAIESNKPRAIETIKPLLEPGMKIATLKTKYPQGCEKQLIWAVTKREVPAGGLPADVGVVVFNVDTCTSVARAILRHTPVTRRIVTVSGGAVKNPTNYLARVGTSVEYILQQAGGFSVQPQKVIIGGPMMGTAIFDLSVPIVKTTSSILALTAEEMGTTVTDPCLRCGDCVSACPMGLSPVDLNNHALKEDWDACEKLGVLNCMECGTCAYLCPSNRMPVQAIRRAKQEISERRRAARAGK